MKLENKSLRRVNNACTRMYVKLRKPVKAVLARNGSARIELAHVTAFSAGNTGDTVLSSCVRELFERTCGPISWRLMDLCGQVDERYIARLNSTDAVVIGGHGAFLPDTHPNDISNWEFACSEKQYDEIKRPIILFAVGYNYFEGQERTSLFESNINKLVECSSFFGLRNTGSVRVVQSFVDEALREKVVYQPCPTMISRKLYQQLPAKRKTGKIAFNVALDRSEMRMGGNVDLTLEQIAAAMKALSERGYDVHFIAHVNRELDFLPYLRKCGCRCHVHPAAAWDAKRAMEFYNEMDVVIGMRGHGIWIPFGVNCQIISLGNQMKTKWFLEDIHALDWFIDIRKRPEQLAQQIIEKFEEIHEVNGEQTDRRLLTAQQELYDITMKNMARIKSIIVPTGGYYSLVILCPEASAGSGFRKRCRDTAPAEERRCAYAA